MTKLTLIVEPRKIFGRKVKKLRKEGKVPANIYGKKVKSTAVLVDLKEFEKVFKDAGETSLVYLQEGKKERAVLVRNIQKSPVVEDILHVDFQEVNLKEKVVAKVPVEVVGESPVEKRGEGTVVQQLDEVEVSALPTDLPEKFEVDVSILKEVDQAIYLKDLKVTRGVEISDDLEKIVVKVEPLRTEEEVPQKEEEIVEGESAEESTEESENEKTEQTPNETKES